MQNVVSFTFGTDFVKNLKTTVALDFPYILKLF